MLRASGEHGAKQTGARDAEASDAEFDASRRRRSGWNERYTTGRLAARTKCLLALNSILGQCDGPLLRTWFIFFDKTQTGRIGFKEFRAGMTSLRCTDDIDTMWTEINHDHADELFFDEIDQDQAALWTDFRRWCGARFEGPREMFREFKRAAFAVASKRFAASVFSAGFPAHMRTPKDIITDQEFFFAMQSLGWEGGNEVTLFQILDLSIEGGIGVRDLKWMDLEVRRRQMKETAKRHAMKMSEQKARTRRLSSIALSDFKIMLRRQYGPLFRAWRRVLDQDGSMTLQRAELFKVCRQLNWVGNMRTLWKALDNDSSGSTTFEELDPHGAQVLAGFRAWAVSIWGPKMAVPLFKDLDFNRRRKLTYDEFARGCEARGYSWERARDVAVQLDWRGVHVVQEDDLKVLDIWRPPDWLVSRPSSEAAEEFKVCLLKKYGHLVRGWRQAMDRDNTSSCSWNEFCEAAKRIKFTGDVPGAWVYFDVDLSGYISLREIDPESFELFMEFKAWADQEFGGCRNAFKIMDTDSSNSLNFREFRSCCRSYGYKGDVGALFQSLDQHGNKHMLMLDEVSFLDDWEMFEPPSTLTPEELEAAATAAAAFETPRAPPIQTPGPGSYTIGSCFGARPWTPDARHGGAFSFGSKGRQVWQQKPNVGPADYKPNDLASACRRRKPAWGFGCSKGPPQQTLWVPRSMMRSSPGSSVKAPMNSSTFSAIQPLSSRS